MMKLYDNKIRKMLPISKASIYFSFSASMRAMDWQNYCKTDLKNMLSTRYNILNKTFFFLNKYFSQSNLACEDFHSVKHILATLFIR